MNKYKFAAIVPAYNPGDAVISVVSETARYIDRIYLVDDGSDSKNKEYLRECSLLDKVSLITLPENRGKGHALTVGLREALISSPDYIFTIDSDGQHNPKEIPSFVNFLEKSTGQPFDFIIGSRNKIRTMPFRSKFGNVLMSFLFYFFFRYLVIDTQSGFRVLSSAFAGEAIRRIPPGRYETEMKTLVYAVNSRRRLHEIPIDTIYIEGNKNSKFRPVQDSARVLSVFSSHTLKFLLDYAVFLGLAYFLNIYFIYSHFVSRAASEAYSLIANRHFKLRNIVSFIFLTCATAALLYALVAWAGISKAAAKPAAEAAIALVGFVTLIFLKRERN